MYTYTVYLVIMYIIGAFTKNLLTFRQQMARVIIGIIVSSSFEIRGSIYLLRYCGFN